MYTANTKRISHLTLIHTKLIIALPFQLTQYTLCFFVSLLFIVVVSMRGKKTLFSEL